MSGTFPGARRAHIGLEVGDLERSVAFYTALLGEGPVKTRPGYAKFEPAEPSLNLALSAGAGGRAGLDRGRAGHFGIQVRSREAVADAARSLAAAGLETRVEEGTSCCHAVQDKVWVHDPDGNAWEVFVVLADEPVSGMGPVTGPGAAESSCCAGGGGSCG